MKRLFILLTSVLISAIIFAQAPSKISYQAVIRNGSNHLVTTQAVGMKISILQGSVLGTSAYSETQTPNTNANGLVSIEIGGGEGFNAINWANGPYFIKTETDPTGGTNYTITGTSQLLSVPYALHSKTAETVLGGITDVAWSLSGNSGTSATTNFLGTTDKTPLTFKVNNQLAGKIDPLLFNTSIGYQSLDSNTTGTGNTANGYQALFSNTTGNSNTANGIYALYNNTTGFHNTATGQAALVHNTTGSYNTANGYMALYSNTIGMSNTAVGYQALNSSIGSSNTANGYEALYLNTTGSSNIATGHEALYSNTTGNYNTANGVYALNSNSTGSYNTANGMYALYSNTTGDLNTAYGYKSLYYNTTGYLNSATGILALSDNTEGHHNTATGNSALFSNTTGTYNTAIGTNTMQANTVGNWNTCIGEATNTSANNLQGASSFGASAIVNADNKIALGANVAGMVIGGYANWSNLSDGRFKEDIKENVPGLAFINRLRPITYWVNTDKLLRHLTSQMNDSVAKRYLPTAKEHAKDMAYTHTGFVAQEVEATAKAIGYTFDGVNAPKNPTDNYSIAYSQFVPSLVKAIQELNVVNDDLKLSIEELKAQNEKLMQRIEKLEVK